MGERTRGTVRLARGVYLRWGWHDLGSPERWVAWRVEARERRLVEGSRRCPLVRAEEVALEQAGDRLGTLWVLLGDAALAATDAARKRRTDHA